MWIAVRANNKDKIAQILELENVRPANWNSGIREAYGSKVFITPQIGDWTLIVGYGLMVGAAVTESDESNWHKNQINKLSKVFGEAQFFATHRVTEYHTWGKSIDGEIKRYYSYLGEKGENELIEGIPTPIEDKFNLINTFSEEANDEKYWEREDIVIPDEDLVMKIASGWSVDPTWLEERTDIKYELGLLGT